MEKHSIDAYPMSVHEFSSESEILNFLNKKNPNFKRAVEFGLRLEGIQLEQVREACDWLMKHTFRPNPNQVREHSYWWKHRVECMTGSYLSEESFIAAVAVLNIPFSMRFDRHRKIRPQIVPRVSISAEAYFHFCEQVRQELPRQYIVRVKEDGTLPGRFQ